MNTLQKSTGNNKKQIFFIKG